MRSRATLVVLLMAAVFQAGFLWRRAAAARTPVSSPGLFLAPGDTVPILQVRREDGARGPFTPASTDGRWTVVMAFRSDCKPSQAVAPRWREWLSASRPVNVLAVTRDSLPAALAYRDAQRWPVRVVSLERPRRGSPEHLLVTRTPWVFLLDPSGVVRFQGHGGDLATVDSLISRSATPPAVSSE